MKKINISILLILCFTTNIIANVTGSLLRHQIRATNNVSTQIKNINKEVTNSIEKSLKRDSMIIVVSDFEKITTHFDSISKKNLTAINQLKETMKIQELCWLERALPQIIGAFITAFVALWIYYCGWGNDRKKITEKKEQIKNQKIHRLSSLTESSIRITKTISSYLVAFRFKIYFNPSKLPMFILPPTQDIKRLSKLFDEESYYHAFINEYGFNSDTNNNFNNLSYIADSLDEEISQLIPMYENMLENHIRREKRYSEIYNQIYDRVICLYETMQGEFANFLDAFIYEYRNKNLNKETNNQFFDLDFIQKEFTEPLILNINSNYKTLHDAKLLLNLLNEADTLYSEIQLQNIEHSKNLSKMEDFLNEVVINLVSINKTLK